MPTVNLTVNGRPWRGAVAADARLIDVLRDHLGLTGTKAGCGEGQCGSCTVIADGNAVRACVTPATGLRAVTTIEGLAAAGRLHPVQQAFLDAQAFQCGFCTPGMIMASIDLLKENPSPSETEIREGIEGNLCRCTGYQNIVKAIRYAAAKLGGRTFQEAAE